MHNRRMALTDKDLTKIGKLLSKQKDDILDQVDVKLETLSTAIDQKLTPKLAQLRDDMNKDFSKTVMPMIVNHDERLDRIDKNLRLPHIPVRLPQ